MTKDQHRSNHATGRPRSHRSVPERGRRAGRTPTWSSPSCGALKSSARAAPSKRCRASRSASAASARSPTTWPRPRRATRCTTSRSPPAGKKLRELLYTSFFVADHATHFYALGGPDFVVGPDAPKAERNILGVVRKVGVEIGATVMQLLQDNHEICAIIGGRYIHPVACIPGGVSKPITEEDRRADRRAGQALGRDGQVLPQAVRRRRARATRPTWT